MPRAVTSVCMLCGCGCLIGYVVEGGRIVSARGVPEDPVSGGQPCFKGLLCWKALYSGRITKPMKRKDRSGFVEISWSEALSILKDLFTTYIEQDVAFTGSGEITNENNYAIQKFARIITRTNNIDTCARLCHAPTVHAFEKALGIGVAPARVDDLLEADCVFLVGTNPLANYPSGMGRRLSLIRSQAKIISVQTTLDITSRSVAHIAVQVELGSELIFINCLEAELIRRGYVDEERLEKIPGWRETRELLLNRYHEFMVKRFCGVRLDVFDEIVEAVGKAKKLVVSHGMGVTQQVQGTDIVLSLVNLAVTKNGFLLPLRGKVNIQGAGDVGCRPDAYPTGPISRESRLRYEELTGYPVPSWHGKKIIDFLIEDPVSLVYVCGMNPAVSLPALNRVYKVLEDVILVYHHPFWTLTAEFADLVLPMPALIETSGTITNCEGRVRVVRRVVEPPGEARPPLWLFHKLAKLMGKERVLPTVEPVEVFSEITKACPAYSELSIVKIYGSGEGWRDKKPKFVRMYPTPFKAELVRRSFEYPFLLRTSRSMFHFCTGDATRRVPELLAREPKPYLYMNPEDMKSMRIEEGEQVKVVSEEASITLEVKPDATVPRGVVVARFHFEEAPINKIIPLRYDSETKTPNYKVIPVRIEKLESRAR